MKFQVNDTSCIRRGKTQKKNTNSNWIFSFYIEFWIFLRMNFWYSTYTLYFSKCDLKYRSAAQMPNFIRLNQKVSEIKLWDDRRNSETEKNLTINILYHITSESIDFMNDASFMKDLVLNQKLLSNSSWMQSITSIVI